MAAVRGVKAAVHAAVYRERPTNDREYSVLLDCGHTVQLRGRRMPRKGRDMAPCKLCDAALDISRRA